MLTNMLQISDEDYPCYKVKINNDTSLYEHMTGKVGTFTLTITPTRFVLTHKNAGIVDLDMPIISSNECVKLIIRSIPPDAFVEINFMLHGITTKTAENIFDLLTHKDGIMAINFMDEKLIDPNVLEKIERRTYTSNLVYQIMVESPDYDTHEQIVSTEGTDSSYLELLDLQLLISDCREELMDKNIETQRIMFDEFINSHENNIF